MDERPMTQDEKDVLRTCAISCAVAVVGVAAVLAIFSWGVIATLDAIF